MPEDPYARHNELLRYVNNCFTIPPLKSILRTIGLSQTGRKSLLKMRLAQRLNDLKIGNFRPDYEILKGLILNEARHYTSALVANTPTNPAPVAATAYGAAALANRTHPAATMAAKPAPAPKPAPVSVPSHLNFRPNPFYMLLQPLCPATQCPAVSDHRNTVTLTFRFTVAQAERLMQDKTYRVFLLCALTDDFIRQAPIQFPQSIEIRANGKFSTANLKGLKNKPGTAKPADLTDLLVLDSYYKNRIDVAYAYTSQRYTMSLQIARKRTVAEIVTRINAGRHIAKDAVIAEMVSKNLNDEDIETGTSVVTLKCPLSFGRLQVPVKSFKCKHLQCFDATSYIQLQEQGPVCTTS
ncbi:PINIT domain-containing protein [Limtongia smithiae]|uniref:PINIT domain-containing protein n=1 Tax=Limtongia smithiae TaxID=1125753 RepID=UPI0034CEFD83